MDLRRNKSKMIGVPPVWAGSLFCSLAQTGMGTWLTVSGLALVWSHMPAGGAVWHVLTRALAECGKVAIWQGRTRKTALTLV